MAEEKIITVNLRRKVYKKPRWKRSKMAITLLRKILLRNTKGKEVKIDGLIHKKIWNRSKKPQTKLKIKLIKEDDKYRAVLVE